jgi:hypothetical protein
MRFWTEYWIACSFCLASFACAPVAEGTHIAGHNPADPTFPIPLPGQDHFSGGAIAGTFIGPPGGTVITGATFDITYVSDGVTPASDIEIFVGIPISPTEAREIHVTGADLGFGSGPGTFSGTFQTEGLNGTVWQNPFFFESLIDLHIGSTGLPPAIAGVGFFVDSAIILDVIPVPEPSSSIFAAVLSAAVAAWQYRRRK